MSVFENKIKRNRSYFDNHEPEKGHEERFTKRLDALNGSKPKKEFSRIILRIAAGFILLLTAGTLIFRSFIKEQASQHSIVNTIDYSDSLENVMAYYDAVSIQKVKEIDKYVPDAKEAERLKKLAIDRLNDIDGSLASIEKELAKNPNDKNIKSALIYTKRKKVEVMDDILMQLDFTNSSLF